MKNVLKKMRKHWITIWLIVATLIFGSIVTYAIYTEVSSVKRVVTTRSAPKELFSSNCMYATLYERRMPSAEFNVNVYNYDQNAPDTPNPADIQYTLTAQLHVKYNGTIMTMNKLQTLLASDTDAYNAIVARATGYSIGKSQDNNTSGTIATPSMTSFEASNNFEVVFGPGTDYETLPGGVISTDRFKVTVPAGDYEKTEPEFYIYVKADPVDSGLTDIHTLLYGSKNVVITASWNGVLAERNTVNTDYDFYNYVITGSGAGKLDIMWDEEWFKVNDFFFNGDPSVKFENNNKTPTTISGGKYDGWKKVTIEVNSSEKSRYELQLYKLKPNTAYIKDGTNDYNAANFIHCELQ